MWSIVQNKAFSVRLTIIDPSSFFTPINHSRKATIGINLKIRTPALIQYVFIIVRVMQSSRQRSGVVWRGKNSRARLLAPTSSWSDTARSRGHVIIRRRFVSHNNKNNNITIRWSYTLHYNIIIVITMTVGEECVCGGRGSRESLTRQTRPVARRVKVTSCPTVLICSRARLHNNNNNIVLGHILYYHKNIMSIYSLLYTNI